MESESARKFVKVVCRARKLFEVSQRASRSEEEC